MGSDEVKVRCECGRWITADQNQHVHCECGAGFSVTVTKLTGMDEDRMLDIRDF